MANTFKVTWTEFKVLKKHDIDRDKPYLWVYGIVVDSTSIKSGNYVIRKPSGSGNLGQKFKKGDAVSVPSSLDISRVVTPMLGKAMAGVVVVAWENALTKDSVITDAYNNAGDMINDFVADLATKALKEVTDAILAGTPLDEIEVEVKILDEQMTCLRNDIEEEIRDTIRGEAGFFGKVVHDHNIGSGDTVLTLEDPFETCIAYRFINGSTDYSLEADLFYGVPAPPGPVRDPGTLPPKHQEPKPTALK
jgi:hypothetical protein